MAWPTYPDGRPKPFGELSPVEQDQVSKAAAVKLGEYLERPDVQKGLAKAMRRAERG